MDNLCMITHDSFIIMHELWMVEHDTLRLIHGLGMFMREYSYPKDNSFRLIRLDYY